MAAAQHRLRRSLDIWPGFVDALATLLIIIIFTLMIFVVAQFYLTDALSGRDRALERLQREIVRLGELLSLERDESDSLRKSLNEISAELQATLSARDELKQEVRGLEQQVSGLELSLGDMETEAQRLRNEVLRLADDAEALRELRDRLLKETEGLRTERDTLTERTTTLEQEQARLSDEAAALLRERDRLAAAADALKRERDKIAEQAAALERERDRLTGTADTLQRERDEMARTADSLRAEREAMGAERDALARAAEVLRRERKALSEQVASLEAERDRFSRRADASTAEVTRKSKEVEEARRALALLNRQVAALREQLASLQEALDAQEALNKDQKVKVEELTQRLNVALAVKVKALEQYRSEFFGRLREVLGERQDIQIVGDRFVFQSEVLFETASAELGDQGKAQLAKLAAALKDIAAKIPEDINWILRVDGHTDKRPIFNLRFRSNWELSFGRAFSVVNFLIGEGIPPQRLAATGFGQFQPIDPGETEEALRRNRRIELKFDQR